MNRSDVIAEVAFQVTDSESPARECGVRVYKPEQSDGAEWVCLVELQGLESHPIEIRGGDSYEALTRALEFVRQHLDACRTSGGRIQPADSAGAVAPTGRSSPKAGQDRLPE